jgi:hypothetical protein
LITLPKSELLLHLTRSSSVIKRGAERDVGGRRDGELAYVPARNTPYPTQIESAPWSCRTAMGVPRSLSMPAISLLSPGTTLRFFSEGDFVLQLGPAILSAGNSA